MSEHVLVPIDETSLLEDVVAYALERYPEAEVTVLHVLTVAEDAPLGLESAPAAEEWRDTPLDLFERAEEVASDYGREIETITLFGQTARTILEYEQEAGVDAIVLGSHGRHGLERLLIGSVAETIAQRASVPVTIVR
ncbi:universal stress protein [Halostagnicola sp. A-GB9-2]|uniref:universal stress protein n=1 Tax=Halostagnicola sp. A-GB9-2 TaxID=3048066 RepID=UPI0024C095BC|nr:universal stress protein [Halostagnicola sp. A-GB9-2]MDJ1431766.1 universal stress protein [Halostagnicola sp. A-GB9-2]